MKKYRSLFVLAIVAVAIALVDIPESLRATVVLPFPAVTNTVIKSSDYNANFNTIINAVNILQADTASLKTSAGTIFALTAAGGAEEVLASGTQFDLGVATCSAEIRVDYSAVNGIERSTGVVFMDAGVSAATTTATIDMRLDRATSGAASWTFGPQFGTQGIIKFIASSTTGTKWNLNVSSVKTVF